MMNVQTDWRALVDRIAGFSQAATLFLERNGGMSNSDAYGTRRRHLLPAARSIYSAVHAFRERHDLGLSISARAAIDRFLQLGQGVLTDENLDNSEALLAAAVALSGFRAELQFQFSDRTALLLRTTERAFQHLQRSIVADHTIRDRWKEAFSDGEPSCEALGSVSLLQHGIWAFKVSAEGGRTDLVFRQPLIDLEAVAGAADGLVLTEWKVVRKPAQLAVKLEEARKQTTLYSAGVLGGLELSSHRYLIVVSDRQVALPADDLRDGVQYRHRGIAVDPDSPSVSARRGP
jgi:hypothetical protein